jgi:YfiH family protein
VRVAEVTEHNRRDLFEDTDALITQLKHVCIGVSTADCVPLLFYDKRTGAIAAAHAGWRGTVARIVEKAVAAMTATYGIRPEDIMAQIGPGISLESFEVGQEVYDAFAVAGFDMPTISKLYPVNNGGSQLFTFHSSLFTSKWHLDLPECNRRQLLASGLTAARIHLSGICTYKACDTFFSARRLGVRSGRIFTGIVLTSTHL